jgi:hypothetical protein
MRTTFNCLTKSLRTITQISTSVTCTHKKWAAWVFLILVNLLACKKEEDSISFRGITTTDEVGHILEEDNTDWTKDVSWSEAEMKLFAKEDAFNYSDLGENTTVTQTSRAFPNPCWKEFQIQFFVDQPSVFKCVIVDNRLNPVQPLNEFKINSEIGLNFNVADRTKFKAGEIYRMYYVFYNKEKKPSYFGHGDIKITN